MANRIKGITIEIDGNATPLQKSLKGVNDSLRTTQSDLKDVNKLLKFDAKNPELLRQKSELLNKAIEDTNKKLEQEKKAMEALKNAPQTEENKRQQELLTREIAETEQALKRLENQSKEFGSVFTQQMKATGEQVQAVGQKVTEVGEGLTKNVTAPILAVGGASLGAFTSVDKGLDIVRVKTGATGEAFEGLESTVYDIAKKIPTDFETIGTAVGEVNTRFGLTGESLDELSTKFIQFAQINGSDVNSTIDSSQKIMTAYGLSIDETSHLLDVMNVVGQNTGVSMETILSALINNTTAFQQLGISAEEGAVLVGKLETSGADVNVVLGGLSKALKSATADGKPLEDALSELNDTVINGADGVDGLQASYDLFGKSGAQVYQAVKSGALDFTDLSSSIDGVGESVSETYDSTISPLEKLQTVLNDFLILGTQIAEAILPFIQSAIETIVPIIQSLIDKWNGLDESTQQWIVKGALIVASIGPIIAIIGNVISVIGTLMTVASTLGTVIGFLTSPVGLVVGAITGLIAIGVLLWKNWDTIKEKASAVWDGIKSKISGFVEGIKSTFENLKASVSNIWNGIVSTISGFVDKIKGFFNFQWQLPHIKLPHFSVSGSANPIDWLTKGLPKINVSWYKSAYQNPVIFNTPTVLPTMNGWKGFGDGNGAEVVMSLNRLQQMMSNGSSPVVNVTVNGAQGQNVNELANIVIRKLTNQIERTNGRW